MTKITTGADIELIATNEFSAPISVEGLIKGSKEKPRLVKCGNVQEDNILPEFAIDIATNKDEFVNNVLTVRSELEKILEKHNLKVQTRAHAYFKYGDCMTPQGQLMGCMPDHNCWTGDENPARDAKDFQNMRTAGGHVHFGFPEANQWGTAKRELTQWFDVIIGVQAIANKFGCRQRSEKYGMAGSYREKDYGIEYRVLSNWWATKRGASWVYDQMLRAYDYFQNGTVEQIFGDVSRDVQDIINYDMPFKAEDFLNERGIELVRV